MKILILDDHALFRDGLNYMLQSIAPDINLIEAATVDNAVALIQEHDDISLALIDLDMPVQDGFDALTLFTSNFATLPCVILSASTKRSDVTKALDLGAVGFISKNSQGEALHNALKLILAGEIYIPYDIMHAERRSERTDRIELTPRQKQIMSQVIQGHSNKVIADKLALAEPTVKMHLTAVYEKLNVHNRTAAIAKLDELRVSLA